MASAAEPPLSPPTSIARPRVLGRFEVRRREAMGDVGDVDVAFDADLDREVALQTIGELGDGRALLLRELQAQAVIVHPNVARIFEVGGEDGRTVVAMEWIRGRTLAAWVGDAAATRPTVPAIVAAMIEAGSALAVAHEAGLVHGGFTLESAIVDGEGRVRVLGFGRVLRGDLDAPARVDADAEAIHRDVVDFVGALEAALHAGASAGRSDGSPPSIPAWLAAIVARGRARVADRAPSIAALVAALREDPARRRRRVVAAGLLAVLIAVALAGLAQNLVAQAAICGDAARESLAFWPAARGSIERTFVATGLPAAGDAWARADPRIDAYAARWIDARTAACEASTTSEPDPARERAAICLDRRRESLLALVNVLGEADETIVLRAVSAVEALPRIEDCAEIASDDADASLPDDPRVRAAVERLRGRLTTARAYEDAGKPATGLPIAEAVDVEAEALGFLPLIADAKLHVGRLLLESRREAEAERTLDAAAQRALEGRLDALAAEALAKRMYALGGTAERRPEAMAAARLAEALAERLGDRGRPLLALALNNEGAYLLAQGETAAALAPLERALAVKIDTYGRDHHETAYTLHNLGLALERQDRLDEALVHYSEVSVTLRSSLGPTHPHIAENLRNIAVVHGKRGDWAFARRFAEESLGVVRGAFPPGHIALVPPLTYLGYVYKRSGDFGHARAYTEQARDVAIGAHDYPSEIEAELALGLLDLEVGAIDEAAATHERLAGRLAATPSTDNATFLLAQLAFGIAQALAATDDGQARARAFAEQAAAGYRQLAPRANKDLERVLTWLADNP